jgi:hypothetical protein
MESIAEQKEALFLCWKKEKKSRDQKASGTCWELQKSEAKEKRLKGEIKPATGEGMDKSTLVHTQIQIIIIHFLPSPFPPIPNG